MDISWASVDIPPLLTPSDPATQSFLVFFCMCIFNAHVYMCNVSVIKLSCKQSEVSVSVVRIPELIAAK